MPNLPALARAQRGGRAAVIPAGLPPGSDVGNMAILGYDPAEFHTGRAPIEAAAMGVDLAPDEVAYRCNLVTIGADGTMVDFAAGHPTSEQSHPIVAALDAAARRRARRRALPRRRRVPPPLCGAPRLGRRRVRAAARPHRPARGLADRSRGGEAARADGCVAPDRGARPPRPVGSIATQIWLWGQGVRPTLPQFADRFGVEGRLTSAVDLVRGLGVLAGIEVLDVPGATAGFDNDYARASATRASTRSADRDFFLLHVEATDEAGHQRSVGEKVAALERWDREIIGPLVDALPASAPYRVLLLPDHATPVRARDAHVGPGAVPLLRLHGRRTGGSYTEPASPHRAVGPAHRLMARLVA